MKFYLIHPNEIRSSIFADINYKKLRLRSAVGIVVNSKNWNQENEKVNTKEEYNSKINGRLAFLKGSIEAYIGNIKLYNKPLTHIEFKSKIESIISPGKSISVNTDADSESISLIKLLETWIPEKTKSSNLRPSTVEKYTYLKLHLNEFSKYTNCNLTLGNVDESFYNEFTRYLMVVKNQVNTTIGTTIKCLKTFLLSIDNRGMKVNRDYKNFKVYQDKKSPTIALSDEDMKKIEELDLTLDPELDTIRDIIFVQYQTLQRVSDLFQLRKEHFDLSTRRITIVQRKTNTRVTIGISKKIESIFTKYNFKLPFYERRQYNDKFKKICKLAGITDEIEIVRKQGSGNKVIVKPKYQLLASHAIRRGSITHLLRKGSNPDFVKDVSGIKTLSIFEQYKRFAKHEAPDAVRELWDDEENKE